MFLFENKNIFKNKNLIINFILFIWVKLIKKYMKNNKEFKQILKNIQIIFKKMTFLLI